MVLNDFFKRKAVLYKRGLINFAQKPKTIDQILLPVLKDVQL